MHTKKIYFTSENFDELKNFRVTVSPKTLENNSVEISLYECKIKKWQ